MSILLGRLDRKTERVELSPRPLPYTCLPQTAKALLSCFLLS